MTLVGRNGAPLDAYAHVGGYGPGTAEYTEEGDYLVAYRSGVLAEHTESFVAAGGRHIAAASGSGRSWAVMPDGKALPVVCGHFIPVMTEDGPSDGRCGADVTVDGHCAPHAEEVRSYFAEMACDYV
jgi:hypothetical protein